MQTMRFIAPFAAVLALSACGGGGGLGGVLGGLGGNTPQCDPGTTVQLANPAPNQFNVSPNIGQITVVANGNADTLYNTYPQWSVQLTSFGGPPIQGGPLQLVDGRNFTHPFQSDFYYASSMPALPQGVTWNATLVENNGNSCTAYPMQSFTT